MPYTHTPKKKILAGYTVKYIMNTYSYSGKKLPTWQVTLPIIVCHWVKFKTVTAWDRVLKPHSLIHFTKPIIYAYKAYTFKQYPLLHVSAADHNLQEATPIFDT